MKSISSYTKACGGREQGSLEEMKREEDITVTLES